MTDGAAEYRIALERFRLALQMAVGLTGTERRVALFMVERSNAELFQEDGLLISWMSEGAIAKCARISERGARKARRGLRLKGVVDQIGAGGHGPRDTARFAFNKTWLARTEAELESAGVLDVWNPAKRGNGRSPLEPELRGNGGAAKGERLCQIRGNGRSPDSLDETPKKEPSESVSTTESVAARASQAEPPSRPQGTILLPLRGGRQTSEGRPAARATPIAQAGARVVADLGAPAAELLAKAGLRRLGDWVRRLAAALAGDLDAAGERLEEIAAAVVAKPGAGIATLEAAVEAELAGAGSRELPASPVRAVATAPSPSRRDPCRCQRWAGCTVDDYRPDPEAMSAWAAANAPLVENPVAPETVEAVKDGWRKRGFSPKDFDAAFRDDLRWRQDRAAQSGARGAAAGGRRRRPGLVAAALAAVAEMAEAAHG